MEAVHPIATSGGTLPRTRRQPQGAFSALVGAAMESGETLRRPVAAAMATPLLIAAGDDVTTDMETVSAASDTFIRSVARAAAPHRLTGWFVDITI